VVRQAHHERLSEQHWGVIADCAWLAVWQADGARCMAAMRFPVFTGVRLPVIFYLLAVRLVLAGGKHQPVVHAIRFLVFA